MKIVFLASDPRGTGGIQRFNGALLAALRENGAETETVYREKFSSPFAFAWSALRTVFRVRPDAVWCGHINFAFLGWLASKFGFRYAVFTHGIETWNLSARQKKYLRRAALVIAVSNFTAERLIRQVPALQKNIFILPNTVDGQEFYPMDKSEAKKGAGVAGQKVILTVARLDARERYKGYDRVLEALPDIIKAMPEAMYVLAGEGSDAGRIRAKAAALGVAGALRMPGRVKRENLRELYNAADVFVMPSTGEGFGIVFLEALACGTPVIAGNKDGSVDALLGGELGLLVDPDDNAAIAAAILTVLQKRLPAGLADASLLRERMLKSFGRETFNVKVSLLQKMFSGEKHA